MAEETKKRSTRAFIIMAVVSLLLTIAAVVVTQWNAQETDYQSAFFRTLSFAAFGGLVTLVLTQVAASRGGRPWLVMKSVIAAIVVAVALVRFEGFSGEMVPRFAFRFSPKSEPPPLLTDESGAIAGDPDSAEANGPGETETQNASDSDSISQPAWPSFLGRNRNGVLSQRVFAIPNSPSDVETKWNIGVGSGWGSFAVGSGLAVTTEQRGETEADSREWIAAYDLDSGALVWKHTNPAYHFHPLGGAGPRTTPAIDDGKVYVNGVAGVVDCLELTTGNLVWSVDLIEQSDWTREDFALVLPWGRAGSPLIVDGLCVVPLGGPETGTDNQSPRSLIALDSQTGEVIWKSGTDQISYASPMLMEFVGPDDQPSRQIVIVNEATVTGHKIASGDQLWSFEWPGDSAGGANCASAIPAGENRFLIGKGYGGGSALVSVKYRSGEWTTEPEWTSSRVMKTKFNHALVDEDTAYGISNGALEAIELSSGKRLWIQSRRDRFGQGQVILAGDTLIAQTEDGEVVFCDASPDHYEELIRIPAMESKTWNIPTLAGRYLIVRNDRQAFCFLLPQRR